MRGAVCGVRCVCLVTCGVCGVVCRVSCVVCVCVCVCVCQGAGGGDAVERRPFILVVFSIIGCYYTIGSYAGAPPPGSGRGR